VITTDSPNSTLSGFEAKLIRAGGTATVEKQIRYTHSFITINSLILYIDLHNNWYGLTFFQIEAFS
jgi:hypothetical protein